MQGLKRIFMEFGAVNNSFGGFVHGGLDTIR